MVHRKMTAQRYHFRKSGRQRQIEEKLRDELVERTSFALGRQIAGRKEL